VGCLKWRLVMNCCLAVWICPAVAQTASEVAPAGVGGGIAMSDQKFHCHTGYSLAQCQRDILQLKTVLSRYPIEALHHWTWVLVRSEDWKPISQRLRLNPESPAFTALDQRETFLEEALFMHDPLRTAELMKEWRLSMSKLLELAVTHELGHAFCEEPSETAADRFGEELRNGLRPPCQVSKRSKKKVESAEPHGLKPDALSAASARTDRMP